MAELTRNEELDLIWQKASAEILCYCENEDSWKQSTSGPISCFGCKRIITQERISSLENSDPILNSEIHSQLIHSLYEQSKSINANVAHVKMEGIYGEKNDSAVVSIYRNQKPCHSVLDELIKWAEIEHNEELLKKIEQLSIITR